MDTSVRVRALPDTRFRGTLKLYTDVKIERGERHLYKRLPLATYHCVELSDNHDNYVAEFRELNPAFADVGISYEFVLRKFG